jgi:hypothetical protein
MSDEVWNSIKAKVYGHYLAAQNLPEYCKGCGATLNATDLGYDPYTNERLWVTYCCGIMEKYVEKVIDNHNL